MIQHLEAEAEVLHGFIPSNLMNDTIGAAGGGSVDVSTDVKSPLRPRPLRGGAERFLAKHRPRYPRTSEPQSCIAGFAGCAIS